MEHAVLSDSSQTIRLDLPHGRLMGCDAVRMNFRFAGIAAAECGVTSLRRLLALLRNRRFAASLAPRDPAIDRGIVMLRVHDATAAGASHREIAGALFGARHVDRQWNGPSDSLRSRVRRLVRGARRMAIGDYRTLLHDASRSRGGAGRN